jgi:hypothetical protein
VARSRSKSKTVWLGVRERLWLGGGVGKKDVMLELQVIIMICVIRNFFLN